MEGDWIPPKMLPAHLICKCYSIYLKCQLISFIAIYSSAVMARCWYIAPEERPSFSELCSIMDQFLTMVSDYTELKMVLVEDANGILFQTLI